MDKQLSMMGVWCGLLFVLLFLVAFVFFAQWMPPMGPSLPANEVATLFQEKAISLRFTGIFITLAAAAYLPFTVMISELIAHLERKSFFLSATQLVAGVMSSFSFFIPGYLWITATFRPDKDPQAVQSLVDLAWLMFITPIAPFIIQYLCFSLAIFRDKGREPLFPRWLAFLQIWVSISFLPGLLAFFFKTGPFAWNGIFVWWVPAVTFSGWFFVMVWYCRKAILRVAD